MDKKYGLEDFRVLNGNSFSKGDIDLLYFSIGKGNNFPKDIKETIDLMINGIICGHESGHGCRVDVTQLEADARLLISLANPEHKPEHIIDVTISSCDPDNKEILLYDEFVVYPDSEMFDIFKRCFMNQLEEALFGKLAS